MDIIRFFVPAVSDVLQTALVAPSTDSSVNGFRVQTYEEKLAELERYESQRDKGMKIARAAAKESGDPKLVLYVELAFTLPDYRAISKKMRVTQAEVKEMEESLIALLQA